MTPDEYIQNVLKTENRDFEGIQFRLQNPRTIRMLHAAMGLCTEAGEFMDEIKKWIIYGKQPNVPNLIEELGDINWYQGIAIDALETKFEQIMEKNIAKLKARYGDKFNEKGALNRDLENERRILEDEIIHYTEHGLELDGIASISICKSKTGRMISFRNDITCGRCQSILATKGLAVMCEHANEVPANCPCDSYCYCKTHTCRIHLAIAGGTKSICGNYGKYAFLSKDVTCSECLRKL